MILGFLGRYRLLRMSRGFALDVRVWEEVFIEHVSVVGLKQTE